jgi:hypothetical protein
VLPSDDQSDLPLTGGAELPLTPTGEETDASAPRLLALARAVAQEPQFAVGGRPPSIRTDSDEVIWNDVQRLFLRFPPSRCQEGRQRSLQYAEQAGTRPDSAPATVLPLLRDEVIYPGLSGTIQAGGLRSAATAPLDPRVPSPANGDVRQLAGIVSTCLWFVENDPHLCHCLRSVFRFGITPLSAEQRQRYTVELLRLWERVRTGVAGQQTGSSRHELKERLKERLDLDEAIHSLVYQPCADAESWWGRLQNQARDTLLKARDRAVAAGCPVHLQVLGGSFADVSRLAPDSLQVDFGVPGEICACLRVWARVDGEEIKGRVLYRSPREGT